MIRIITIFFLFFIASELCFAEDLGIGKVADNLMAPIEVLANFIHAGCILIGGSFIFAGVIKYIEHRRSPLMVPISTVIFLFIAGAVLILLPLLAYLTQNGLPYSLQ